MVQSGKGRPCRLVNGGGLGAAIGDHGVICQCILRCLAHHRQLGAAQVAVIFNLAVFLYQGHHSVADDRVGKTVILVIGAVVLLQSAYGHVGNIGFTVLVCIGSLFTQAVARLHLYIGVAFAVALNAVKHFGDQVGLKPAGVALFIYLEEGGVICRVGDQQGFVCNFRGLFCFFAGAAGKYAAQQQYAQSHSKDLFHLGHVGVLQHIISLSIL